MYLSLKKIKEKNLREDEYVYEIKKFIRKKLNQAFEDYLKDHPYSKLSFKRAKVKLMLDWGIDEYMAYHITELFPENIEYTETPNGKKVKFPMRGKNISEDLLMRILANMNIDPVWLLSEPLDTSVRFLDTSAKSKKYKSQIIIPVYQNLNQLSENNTDIILDETFLKLLGLDFITSNEKPPIFRYYNYIFVEINNNLYLANLWDQDLNGNDEFLVYKESDIDFEILKNKEIIARKEELFVLGKILAKIKNIIA